MCAAVVDNGVEGTQLHFADTPGVSYRVERITDGWNPDFSFDDIVIVPNGADHIAMYRVRQRIEEFLERGGVLLCFCGFFTPWVPGNQWFHDNSRPNRLVRYHPVNDLLGILDRVDIDALATNEHGISGWWSCGGIETAAENVVLADTWDRPVLVADTRSTPGLIVASSSGPLGEFGDQGELSTVTQLYRNILAAATRFREAGHV